MGRSERGPYNGVTLLVLSYHCYYTEQEIAQTVVL